jgi:hypothetical protein
MGDNFKSVAIDFAKKLGEHEYRELASNLVGVSFKQAFINLQGYNLDDVEGFFDCNYKDISLTIWRTKFGGCMLNSSFDVWHGEISSPICENVFITDNK